MEDMKWFVKRFGIIILSRGDMGNVTEWKGQYL